MRPDRDPTNSDPFKLIEELNEAAPNSPLFHVAQMFRNSPLETWDLRQVASHPRLPAREWTSKELGEISRWLHEIEGITEATLITVGELLIHPMVTAEDRDEYAAVLKLKYYLETIAAQVFEQKI